MAGSAPAMPTSGLSRGQRHAYIDVVCNCQDNALPQPAGSLIGGVRETQEMLDFRFREKIYCDIELIPAAKINEAYERTIKGDVKYRFVIDAATY